MLKISCTTITGAIILTFELTDWAIPFESNYSWLASSSLIQMEWPGLYLEEKFWLNKKNCFKCRALMF